MFLSFHLPLLTLTGASTLGLHLHQTNKRWGYLAFGAIGILFAVLLHSEPAAAVLFLRAEQWTKQAFPNGDILFTTFFNIYRLVIVGIGAGFSLVQGPKVFRHETDASVFMPLLYLFGILTAVDIIMTFALGNGAGTPGVGGGAAI